MKWVAPKDEVIAPLGRAAPDVYRLETTSAKPVKISYEDFMVNRGAEFPRPEVLHCTTPKISMMEKEDRREGRLSL